MKLSSALQSLSVDPHAKVDLARVALLIARDAYPQMSPRGYLRRIGRLADQLRPRLKGSLAARTAELSTFLFEECGFAGNTESYYDPRNSYLNKVLDRQVGKQGLRRPAQDDVAQIQMVGRDVDGEEPLGLAITDHRELPGEEPQDDAPAGGVDDHHLLAINGADEVEDFGFVLIADAALLDDRLDDPRDREQDEQRSRTRFEQRLREWLATLGPPAAADALVTLEDE